MRYFFLILTIILVVSACEREAHIDIPAPSPKLVVESQQGQDINPETWISRIRSATDPLPQAGQPNPYIVKNAVALIFENDVFQDTLRYNSSTERYQSTVTTIQPARTYRLELSAPDFPTAEAISVTPTLVPI